VKKKLSVKEPVRYLPLPTGVTVGGLVRYYDEGWRTGYLMETDKNEAGIRPCGPIRKRLTWVNISDLEALTKGEK
jgi:hypothetical protein